MTVTYAIISILLISTSISKPISGCYESIISFGDSLADTGNMLLLSPPDKLPRSARPPYGQTFFHHPTGRYCDGRLVTDFIAERLGLPLVPPYISGENTDGNEQSFRKGVNFAVAGATALDYEYLEKLGIHNPTTNVSLGTQLDWFKQFLAKLPAITAAHVKETLFDGLTFADFGKRFLQSSLVLVGEIGGNDYSYLLNQETNPVVIKSFATIVVNYIGSTIEELIKLGVKTMLVPGILPSGCKPNYLTSFKSSNVEDYDPKTGCLNWLNELSTYHNDLLEKELSRIQELNPQVTIIYADYYNAAIPFYLSPNKFGFKKGILSACCGAGGSYNFNISTPCGSLQATSCDDPSSFVSWDGIHYTEAAYRLITRGLFEGPYTTPHITTVCPSISKQPGFCHY